MYKGERRLRDYHIYSHVLFLDIQSVLYMNIDIGTMITLISNYKVVVGKAGSSRSGWLPVLGKSPH